MIFSYLAMIREIIIKNELKWDMGDFNVLKMRVHGFKKII